MHRLDRNSVVIPACLTPTIPPRRYADLRGPEKAIVRDALLAVQKQRCGYCERRTGNAPNDGHVEHFRKQADHPHLETDWNNLFWSCNDENTCGKYKDKCNCSAPSNRRTFDLDSIIKPCTDDPEHFMMFVSDGTMSPCAGLSASEQLRYSETLRVFQLAESPYLCKSREDSVKPYIGILDALRAAGPEVLRNYITSELGRVDSAPFATAIRHFLESNLL